MTDKQSIPQSDSKPAEKPQPKKANWLKVSVITNIAIVVVAALVLAGVAVVHQSNTNPEFCATCHLMKSHVDSYMTGTNLDNVHKQAGVQCKQCHDYGVVAEITSGIKYITGNYTVDAKGELAKRQFPETMCTKCHISEAHVATLTDFLAKNPHDSHNGELPCNTCHVSHGQQIDFCSECHDNGGQRMIGAPIESRGTIGG